MAIELSISYRSTDSHVYISNTNVLQESFKWLDRMLLYTPMWVTKSPNISFALLQNQYNQRNKCVSFLMAILIIFVILSYTIIFIWILIHNIESATGNDHVYLIMWVITTVLLLIVRLLSLIYFMANFNYPWNLYVDHFNDNIYQTYSAQIRKYKNFILLITILCFF